MINNTVMCITSKNSHSKDSVHWVSAINTWIRSKCVGYSSQDPHEQTRPSTEYGLQNHTWRNEEHTHSYHADNSWSETPWLSKECWASHTRRKSEMNARPSTSYTPQRLDQDYAEKNKPQPCLDWAAEETIWHPCTKTRKVWNAYAQPYYTKSCPQILHTRHHTKSSDSEATLKTLKLVELDKSYPATAWTQVFTDWSAENATRNGGRASTSDSQTSLWIP